MVKNRTTQKLEIDGLAPALEELVGWLDPAQLENVAIASILEHRRLLVLAEEAYVALNQTQDASERATSEQRETYVRAMLNSKAQMSVVAILVDKLGYVPETPNEAG